MANNKLKQQNIITFTKEVKQERVDISSSENLKKCLLQASFAGFYSWKILFFLKLQVEATGVTSERLLIEWS